MATTNKNTATVKASTKKATKATTSKTTTSKSTLQNTKSVKLTDLEYDILSAVFYSDYQDRQSPVGHQVWYIDSNDVDMQPKQIAGSVASCNKKGFVVTDTTGGPADHTIAFTQLGYDKFIERQKANDVKDTSGLLKAMLLKHNIELADTTFTEFHDKVIPMLTAANLTMPALEHMLFEDTTNQFALFNCNTCMSNKIWTKYRIARRLKRSGRVIVDISTATTNTNNEIIETEYYVSSMTVSMLDIFNLMITQCTSFDSPFFSPNSTI
jgi:hypothetical protein